MSTVTESNFIVPVAEMINKLEPLLRRIAREEIERVIEEKANVFHLEPEMPLYQDLEELLQRKKAGKIELYSEAEVWNG